MKDAMVLRNGLAPYIYTAVRNAYDTGVGLLRPMYYSHPEAEEAYDYQATQVRNPLSFSLHVCTSVLYCEMHNNCPKTAETSAIGVS